MTSHMSAVLQATPVKQIFPRRLRVKSYVSSARGAATGRPIVIASRDRIARALAVPRQCVCPSLQIIKAGIFSQVFNSR